MSTSTICAILAYAQASKYLYHTNDSQTVPRCGCMDLSSDCENSDNSNDPDLQVNLELSELSTSTGEIYEIDITNADGTHTIIDFDTVILPPPGSDIAIHTRSNQWLHY